MEAIARRCGAVSVTVAADNAEALRLATARRAAFSALARVSPTTILEDATVPRSELTKMINFIQEVGAKHRLQDKDIFQTLGHQLGTLTPRPQTPGRFGGNSSHATRGSKPHQGR